MHASGNGMLQTVKARPSRLGALMLLLPPQWQVITQIHSARAIHQVGRYTWIVSGCPDEKGNDEDHLT
jgi:hypothetical protein